MIIGHEVIKRKPYKINNSAPIEFMIRNVWMFFMRNEIINTNEAK